MFRERRREHLRRAAAELEGVHGRTPEPVADLMAAVDVVRTVPGLERLAEGMGQSTFGRSWSPPARRKKAHLHAADPAVLFADMLGGAVASGEAHLSPVDAPEDQPGEFDAAAWGWRKIKDAWANNLTGEEHPAQYSPQGRRVGYADEDKDRALLIGPAAYGAAERMAGRRTGARDRRGPAGAA